LRGKVRFDLVIWVLAAYNNVERDFRNVEFKATQRETSVAFQECFDPDNGVREDLDWSV